MKYIDTEDFFTAIDSGVLQRVMRQVDSGINIDQQDSDGNTVLHLAVLNQDIQVVCYLLSKNITLNTINNIGYTPLHLSCFMKSSKILRELLYAGANVNVLAPRSVLEMACKYGNIEMLGILFEFGCDISVIKKFYRQGFGYELSVQNPEVLAYLNSQFECVIIKKDIEEMIVVGKKESRQVKV